MDAVDVILDQWHRERPELDPSSKAITGRIIRLTGIFQGAYHDAFAPLGITDADYGMLVSVRRAGAPFEVTPTELARLQMMTSGGMTAAIDRLERRGLLARRPNPDDRRGSLVRLTEEGRRVVEAAMELQVDVEHRLVDALTKKERAALVTTLRKLLLSIDTPLP